MKEIQQGNLPLRKVIVTMKTLSTMLVGTTETMIMMKCGIKVGYFDWIGLLLYFISTMYFQHCIHIHALAGSAQYDFCRGGKKLNLQ